MRTIGVGSKIVISLLALISFSILLSNYSAYAEESSVSTATVTINQSCSMVGTTNTAHTANLANGTYSGSNYPNGIGQTTLKVFCNDSAGFAIYAIGYTGNEYGNTKLHNDTLGTANDISTGVYVSGTTVNSTWSMKLASVSGTYAPTITDGTNNTENFTTWHTIPTEYTKVAYRTSTTDADNNGQGTGSSLTTTYDAYVSATQPAGTYVGQVKYTLVHPNTAPEPLTAGKVGVIYNANGSIFNGGTTTNRVVYAGVPVYIANTPQIAKSSNVSSDGTKESSYTSSESVFTPVTATGASKMKVVLQYGLSSNAGLAIIEGDWDGNSTPTNYEMISGENTTGTTTYFFNGDAVTFYMMAGGEPASGYDYGFFAQVYPVYATEQTGTSQSTDVVVLSVDSGTYAQTNNWYGSWYTTINNQHYEFIDEAEVKAFISDNIATLSGTNIELYRSLTVNEAYAMANKTQYGGYYIQQDMDNNICQTVAIGQNGTVKDSRDNNTYMIGRLKDGRCWMLDNLALDPTDATTAANMNSGNTNATAEAISNYLNGGSSNTGWSNSAVANVAPDYDDLNNSFVFMGYTVPRISNHNKDTLVTSYGPASINGQAKVGIYYNFCAATVGTNCYDYYLAVDIPDTLIDASQDICPAGWRMPTGGLTGEYAALADHSTTVTATDPASLQYILSTPLSGLIDDSLSSTGDERNVWGYWWSSTYYAKDNKEYQLGVTSTDIYCNSYRNHRLGLSVRCLVSE